MNSGIYFHGYNYTTGALQLGAPCVAPIIEVKNTLAEPLEVSWVCRTPTPEAFLEADKDAQAPTNVTEVLPGQSGLIAGLLSSTNGLLSMLQLKSDATLTTTFVFDFTADKGYFFTRVPHPCANPSCGEPFTIELLQASPFLLNAKTARASLWRNAIVCSTRAVKIPLTASLPCIAAQF